MLSELYKIYRDSNISLARSIVIKSEATIDAHLDYFEMIGRPESQDKKTWKYYLNLAGEYHWSDEPMTVLSSDTQEPIPFTKEVLVDHPLTRTEYSRGGKHRDLILTTYPDSEILIDRIIDPIDIDLAIAAKDLTILIYDKTLVAGNEVNLIPKLQNWIYNFGIRWNVSSMAVTDTLYPAVFLGNLFLAMVNEISNIRIANMKTPMASEWHIWTYLSGHLGLDDYKEYLSTYQALWLYRNIEYIRRNAGKQEVMDMLVENLIQRRGLSLTKFDMIKAEDILKDYKKINVKVNKSDINEPNPVIDVGALLSPEGMFELTRAKAINNGYNLTDDAEYFEKRVLGNLANTRKLGVVEVSQTLNVLSRFSNQPQLKSDYWIYLSTIGLYRGSLTIPIPGKTALNLSPLEALILMIHTANKAFGIEMTHIPEVIVRGVIPQVYPTRETVAGFLNDGYVKKEEVLDLLFDDLVQLRPLDSLNKLELFVDECVDQDFNHYFAQELARREEGRAMIRSAGLSLLRNQVCVLSPEGLTFQQWLDSLEIDLENLTESDYLEVAVNCLATAAGNDKATTGLPSGQKALVELFDNLTSYSLITLEGRSFNANSTLNWHFSDYNSTDTRQEHKFPLQVPVAVLGDDDKLKLSFKYSDVVEKTSISLTDKGLRNELGEIEVGLKPTINVGTGHRTYVSNRAPFINNLKVTHVTD